MKTFLISIAHQFESQMFSVVPNIIFVMPIESPMDPSWCTPAIELERALIFQFIIFAVHHNKLTVQLKDTRWQKQSKPLTSFVFKFKSVSQCIGI